MFRITKVRIILLTIVCMGFLSACDPSPKPFSVVLQVAAVGDKVYAYTVDRWSWGPGCCAYGEPVFYYSEDGGQSWSKTDTVPSDMEKKLSEAKSRISRSGNSGVDGLGRVLDSDDGGKTWREDIASYPVFEYDELLANKSLNYQAICAKGNPQLCFRLSQERLIESSMDGGVSWRTDWQIAVGRQLFLERSYSLYREYIPQDLHPFDLTILENESGVTVVAAMGNQGVIVRDPGGRWTSKRVGEAIPLNTTANDMGEVFEIVSGEALRSFVGACLLQILLSGTYYVVLGMRLSKSNKSSLANKPLVLAFIFGLILLILLVSLFDSFFGEISPLLCVIPLIAMLFVVWMNMKGQLVKSEFIWAFDLTFLVSPTLLFLSLILPYVLWAKGVIALFEQATELSIISCGVVLIALAIANFKLADREPVIASNVE